ncbi:cilia- and flagella-associated protein 221-like [Ruditapes philippinarum]|uniref:cilia- and flagella-associated protein 221-like n=1 Tax=Ruditapes philippinarum TaxID=129788 RepID=UPI00295BE580|nr:cilia- and flagella-associated protein 221-like [Ruditapes philippinarum]
MPAVETMNRGLMGQHGPTDTSGLLIETMQIEEPRKSQHVPNHVLETKIYTKIAQNSMVLAKPSVIHFGGFEVDKKHTLSLSIVNVSTEVIRMHVIPPQTKYFYIKYTKNERLVPGLTLDCTIEFTPDEWRYYYDCIRINCPGEENLVIPIHAYPVMSTKDFPQLFNFPPVPVGHKMTKVFPLRCEAPIDFEFQLTYLQPHQAFTVNPMSGIIPANGETEVAVTFCPIEFHTAYMRIQLVISQFNSNPIVCTFTGTSVPGLLKDETLKYSFQYGEGSEESLLDPRSLTPVERARRKKKKLSLPPPTNVKQEVEYQGVKFPVDLNNPYAVSQVLNQEPGKLRAKDLRDVVVTKDSKPKAATRQMKIRHGLQVFQLRTFAGTSADFNLLSFYHGITGGHSSNCRWHKRSIWIGGDVVRGIMTWKEIPSQGLTSLSNTPTLDKMSGVPRWDDPFGEELLPQDVPALLDSLPEDDGDNIVDDEEEDGRSTSRMSVALTPDMVNAQFQMIDPSTPADEKVQVDAFPHGNKMPASNIPVSSYGPVPREKREEELEYFMTKKYNRLGAKIQSRINTLNTLSTDSKLVLK